jgi:hypothetical protein
LFEAHRHLDVRFTPKADVAGRRLDVRFVLSAQSVDATQALNLVRLAFIAKAAAAWTM